MKLLFDQNLSPFLSNRLADIFPASGHVQDVGLDRADDAAVWNYVRANTFIIVSKDSDFHERKVFCGRCSLAEPGALLGYSSAQLLQSVAYARCNLLSWRALPK